MYLPDSQEADFLAVLLGVPVILLFLSDMSEDYALIDKAQLISMIHYLEKRDEASKKENEELKELIKELQETHNQKVKSHTDLLASIERLTKQVADLTEDTTKSYSDKLMNC